MATTAFEEAWQFYVDDVEAAVDETVAEMFADWEAGLLPPPPLNVGYKAVSPSWQEIVSEEGFSPVMGLVHEIMGMDEVDTLSLADELFKARKIEFEDAVSDYVAQMGGGGKADLRNKMELSRMRTQSEVDASSIVDTYNRDLAKVIKNIRGSTPTANRHVYVSRMRAWEAERRTWKMTQISLHTVMTARDQALKAFSKHNGLEPKVQMMPRTAKEPICEGWINRGVLPYNIAKNNPAPYHVGCLHFWQPIFENTESSNLWVGQ